jgi:hypothetical protein
MKIDFAHKHASLKDILLDNRLAKIGDAFVNFVFSLAVSNKQASPTNVRVSSDILSEALKRTGYRKLLPSRIDRHKQGDAVEALIVYAWLEGGISLEECVSILQEKADIPVEAFTDLITTSISRLDMKRESD